MTLKDYFANIVTNNMPDGTGYFYGRNTDFNVVGDNVPSPVVLVIEPDQGFLNVSPLTGNVNSGDNLFVRFITEIKTETGQQLGISEMAPTRADAIASMKALAARFVADVSNDDLFVDFPVKVPLVYVIEAYDGNWFGVEININNLQAIYPFEIC